MESTIETLIEPWIDELKRSFSAYPEFVERVTTALPLIEERLVVLEAAAKENVARDLAPEARQEMNALLERFESELESTRAAADSATRELTTLKRELQARDAEIERLRTVAPVPMIQKAARTKRDLSEKRVLLIDDAEVNRVLLSHYLKGLPVRLDYATTVSKAVELCTTGKYDLLILDTGLVTDGNENVLSDLKSTQNGALLFALTEKDDAGAELPGFSGVLSRGLSRESLVERLSKNLWTTGDQNRE